VKPIALNMVQQIGADPEARQPISGIGGVSNWRDAAEFILLGCGTVQVCTAAMLDHAIGPNVIKRLNQQYREFLEKHESQGWHQLEDFRGLRRDRVVLQSQIRRPEAADYNAGFEPVEGYAAPA
jgi:dihydropyrimidine dehydrogenase (NAD+) subunit PreA